MPELPEVETIKREIIGTVKNRTLVGVEYKDPRNIKEMSPQIFKEEISGEKILGVERRAKYLLFKLKSGRYLVIHLGMAGRLLLKPDKYLRLTFKLSGGKELYFSDLRMFGKIWLCPGYPDLKLGPEPLSREFTFNKFKEIALRKKGAVKLILMDQSFLAGVGNIYASEALFSAGIRPDRRIEKLSEAELKKLYFSIKKVLKAGIVHKGSSVDNFIDAFGKQGTHQNYLNVYDRKGKPCHRCKTPIQKISMGQRGTYFCPGCQL